MVFATAVDDWLTTVAWANVSPGITAMSTSPYASRLPIATALNVDSRITLIVADVRPHRRQVGDLREHPEEQRADHHRAEDAAHHESPTTALLGRQHPRPDNPGTLCAHHVSTSTDRFRRVAGRRCPAFRVRNFTDPTIALERAFK